VVQVIVVGRIVPRWRNLKDGKCSLERLTGTEILICFSGLQDTCVANLMTGHADVVGQLTAQMLRIDNGGVGAVLGDLAFAHCFDMRSTRAMTVLATD
jgi:hypothetical protein